MIEFPTSLTEATARPGDLRAGGTDLQERRKLRIAEGPVVDLRDVPGLDAIAWQGDGLRIGALVTLAALAEHPDVRRYYPAVAAAAGGLATPQIRQRATLGGNLLQHVRCWYYRRPGADCLRRGGATCQARAGDHDHHVCFDRGACVAPNPSTMATALLAHDVKVEVAGAPERTLEALYGEPAGARSHHALPPGAVLSAVQLPRPLAHERAAYVRAISRARAEWPLVEVVARLVVEGDSVRAAIVTAGAVASVPLRLLAVERELVHNPTDEAHLAAAAARAADGASPLPGTAYKRDLMAGTVLEALERALAQEPAPPR